MKSSFFIIIITIIQANSSIIKTPFNLKENYITIELTVGTPGVLIRSPFNTVLPFTWFIPSYYSHNNSPTSISKETNKVIILDDVECPLQCYDDTFSLN